MKLLGPIHHRLRILLSLLKSVSSHFTELHLPKLFLRKQDYLDQSTQHEHSQRYVMPLARLQLHSIPFPLSLWSGLSNEQARQKQLQNYKCDLTYLSKLGIEVKLLSPESQKSKKELTRLNFSDA